MFEVIDWSVIEELIKINFNINFRKKGSSPDDFCREEDIWIRSWDYQDLEDIEILSCLEELKKFEGDLYIITDASYNREFGPYKIKSEDIHEFIENHWSNFGEYLVNTDLLIFNFELKLLWMFHHEGVYSVLNFNK